MAGLLLLVGDDVGATSQGATRKVIGAHS